MNQDFLDAIRRATAILIEASEIAKANGATREELIPLYEVIRDATAVQIRASSKLEAA